MDIPLSSLKYIFNEDNSDPQKPRYEPYGILITKKFGYKNGCRPVLYLSNTEINDLKIPKEELWRTVRLEVKKGKWISWVHEREWRSKGNFKLPKEIPTVFVKTTKDVKRLTNLIQNKMSSKSDPKVLFL